MIFWKQKLKPIQKHHLIQQNMYNIMNFMQWNIIAIIVGFPVRTLPLE